MTRMSVVKGKRGHEGEVNIRRWKGGEDHYVSFIEISKQLAYHRFGSEGYMKLLRN